MTKFKFHEEQDVRGMIESNSFVFSSVYSAMYNAALYYTKIKRVEYVFDSVVEFMENKYKDFNYKGYVSQINKCISSVNKYYLKNIDYICITKSEIEKIMSLDDIKQEKIAFVMLAFAKYHNAASDSEKDTFYAKTSEIFKYARVSIPARDRDAYLHFAYEKNILTPNYSLGYDAKTVAFISHDGNDEIVLKLDEYDYLELAYAYLNYKNGGYKRCKECGRWFKMVIGKPNIQYCHLHKKEAPESVRVSKCINCGTEFSVDARNTTKKRCDKCQNDVNRALKSIVNKKYYESHKI